MRIVKMTANIIISGLLLSANETSLKSCLESHLSKSVVVKHVVLKINSENTSKYGYVTFDNVTTENVLSQLKGVCYNGKYIMCKANDITFKQTPYLNNSFSSNISNSNLDSFKIMRLQVTHVEDFNTIYAVEEDFEKSGAWNDLALYLDNEAMVNCNIVLEGDKFYGYYTNHTWMRVHLIEQKSIVCFSTPKLEMQLVDYGPRIEVIGNSLCELPVNLQEIPPFALQCRIHQLTAVDANAAVNVLRKELVGKCFEAHVFRETGANKAHIFKRLSIDFISGNDSIRLYLINQRLASVLNEVEVDDSTGNSLESGGDPLQQRTQDYYISYYNINSDNIVEIFFQSAVDSSLASMSSWLNLNCSKLSAPIGALDSRRLYAAQFSADGVWYRCAVLCDRNSNALHVNYVDFGNSEEKKLSDLVTLPDEIATAKPLSMHCYLAGVTINSSRKDDLSALIADFNDQPVRLTFRKENRLLAASSVDVWISEFTTLTDRILDRGIGYPFKEKSADVMITNGGGNMLCETTDGSASQLTQLAWINDQMSAALSAESHSLSNATSLEVVSPHTGSYFAAYVTLYNCARAWRRVQVLKQLGVEKVSVRLVDLLEEDIVLPINQLRHLPNHCSISRLPPIRSLEGFPPDSFPIKSMVDTSNIKLVAPRCMANFNMKALSSKENIRNFVDQSSLTDKTLEHRAITQVISEINKLRRVLHPLEQLFGVRLCENEINTESDHITLLNIAVVLQTSTVDLELVKAKRAMEEMYCVWQDQRQSLKEYVMMSEATVEVCSEKLALNHLQRDEILKDLDLLENALNGSREELTMQSTKLDQMATFLERASLQLGFDGGKENVVVPVVSKSSIFSKVEEWLSVFVKRGKDLFLVAENCRAETAAASQSLSNILSSSLTAEECVDVATKLPSALNNYWNALCELRKHLDLRGGQATGYSERWRQLRNWTLSLAELVESRRNELDGVQLLSNKFDTLREELQAEKNYCMSESFWQEALSLQRSVRSQVKQLRRALVDLQDAEDDLDQSEEEKDTLIRVISEQISQLRDCLHETLEHEEEICELLLSAINVSPEILLTSEALRLNLRQRRSLLRFWEPNYLEAKALSDNAIYGVECLFISRWRAAPALLLKLTRADVTFDLLNRIERCAPLSLLRNCGVRAAFRPRNEPQQFYLLLEAGLAYSALSSEMDNEKSAAFDTIRRVLKELCLNEELLVVLLHNILNIENNSTLEGVLDDENNMLIVVQESQSETINEEESTTSFELQSDLVDVKDDDKVDDDDVLVIEPISVHLVGDSLIEIDDSTAEEISVDEKDCIASTTLLPKLEETECESAQKDEDPLDDQLGSSSNITCDESVLECLSINETEDCVSQIVTMSASPRIAKGLGRGSILASRELL